MTRETKIGLLVGLAFIIVIGILLSDHLTSSTEPPPAALSSAAGTVRGGVASPGADGDAYLPITPATVSAVTPQQQVPTGADLKPPVDIVAIGPANTAPTGSAQALSTAQSTAQPAPMAPVADPRVMIGPAQANAAPLQPASTTQQPAEVSNGAAAANGGVLDPSAPVPPAAPANNATPAVASANPGPTDQDLASVAASHGEPLIGNDGKPVTSPRSAKSAPGNGGDYVAQSGDTLSRMASRFLGANTATNRNAIIRLNPNLKSNPDRIIVGQTYHIPAAAPAVAAAQQPQDPAAQTTTETTPTQPDAQQSSTVATSGTETLYTVQPNDSLWKIASQQLGSPSAIDAIKELNKDMLKGDNHDVLYAGMKIKLPARVAQAQ